jgi:hypothetical protein
MTDRLTFPTTVVAAAVLSASISWTHLPSGSTVAADRVSLCTDSAPGPLFVDSNVIRPAWFDLARSVFPKARDLTKDEGEAYEAILRDLFR